MPVTERISRERPWNHCSKSSAEPGSALGFGRAHNPKDQGHRPKSDIAEVDWSSFVPIEQDRAHAATNEPNRAQQNENKHWNPPRTLKAVPTHTLSKKFTLRESINSRVRLRGHTTRITRSSNHAGQIRVVEAGMKWPSSGRGGVRCGRRAGPYQIRHDRERGAIADQPCCRNQLDSKVFRHQSKKYCGDLAGAKLGSRAKPPLPHQAACAMTARTIVNLD